MTARRGGIVGASLLAAAIVALPVPAAQAERVQASKSEVTLDVSSAADSCTKAVKDARAWLKEGGAPSTGNARTLANRMRRILDGMWNGTTKQRGLKILRRLVSTCHL
jgi:hypothetical protein